jgi:xanthine/CO dehydrogenase XdhC/CoxF family maturation factor
MGPPTVSDPLITAAMWRQEGLSVALATVVKTWGSFPRQPGA